MDKLVLFNNTNRNKLLNKRSGESKFGQHVQILTSISNIYEQLKNLDVTHVILGLPEDVGVFANHGKTGASKAWEATLKVLLNIHSNEFTRANKVLILGRLDFTEEQLLVSKLNPSRKKDILKATVSWPFYSGGKKKYKISKNTNLTTRKRLLLDDVIKTSDTNVASAWSSLSSSKSFLNSVKVQVRAAQIANEGIAAEYDRGSRTTLDVIQSNSLLLSAQISLADSQRNYLMAQYNLLKASGLLNSQYLKLQ